MKKHEWTKSAQVSCAALILASAVSVARADDDANAPTFSKEVSRIFQANCQECHRPNQMAPMSLLTYQEARPWAKSIKKAVAEKTMPPWHADAEPGKFSNDISLSPEEIAAVVRWVDSGAPEGNPADLPPAKTWDDNAWKAGTPDIILEPKEGITVPPTKPNEDIFHCIVLPTGLKEDTWLQGIELRAGEPRAAHHMLGFIDNVGRSAVLDAKTPEPGYPCDMSGVGVSYDALAAGHAPGTPPTIFHEGAGKLVKANASIVLQMHYYNKTENTLVDKSSVGLFLAKKPIKKLVRITPVSQFNLKIKAGDPNAENIATWKPSRDLDIGGIMPHMHFIGKDMKVFAIYADGREELLLDVPRFDFNWQTAYEFAKPPHIPAGTTIKVVGHHDNSAENPRNPVNPPVDVKFGESTGSEMMIGWIGYTFTDEDLTRETAAAAK